MKRTIQLLASTFVFFAMIFFISSCQKADVDSPTQNSHENEKFGASSSAAKVIDFDMQEYLQSIAQNELRVAGLEQSVYKASMANIMVPKDFPTIQEAVDAAADNAVIIVKSGTYDEKVTVYKPGLFIKADGNVILNGGFELTEDADNVSIHNFTINVSQNTFGAGINAVFVDGSEIKHNTIISDGSYTYGIRFIGSSDNSLKMNEIVGVYWGIILVSVNGISSSGNHVLGNTIQSTTYASSIGLQGSCENNVINENTVTGHTGIFNAGIILYSILPGSSLSGDCINNEVKNNSVTEHLNVPGCWLFGNSNGNTIGPNNTFSTNAWGIYVSPNPGENLFFNNTALNNSECDITDEDSSDNTYKNNDANCVELL